MRRVRTRASNASHDRAARPVDYRSRAPQVSTLASRTMRWGGALLLVFIVVHVLHFTTGTIRPAGAFTPGDVYANVTGSFRIWWVTLFYVAAMAALGLHLYHGAWSSVRTLGSERPAKNLRSRPVAVVLAAHFGARTLVPWIFSQIVRTRSRELFILTIIFVSALDDLGHRGNPGVARLRRHGVSETCATSNDCLDLAPDRLSLTLSRSVDTPEK